MNLRGCGARGAIVFGIGLGLFAGVSGAGCSFSVDLPSVGGPELEQRVASWLRHEDMKGTVSCPKRVRKAGDVFACEITTTAGSKVSLTVRVGDDTVSWKIERLVDTKSIASNMEEKLGGGVTISCRERYLQVPVEGAAYCKVLEKGAGVGQMEIRYNAAEQDFDVKAHRFEPGRSTGA